MPKEYEVRCVGVDVLVEVEGGAKVPEFHPMGKIVEIPDDQAKRLLEMGAIQEPGANVLANDPKFVSGPTPFSQSTEPWVGPAMGDPNAGAAVGGLTPEQAAEFEAQATGDGRTEDEEFEAGEATDEELFEYLEEKKPNVSDTLALAMDDDGEYDPVLVERVLEAEQARSSPRTGVVDALFAESEKE